MIDLERFAVYQYSFFQCIQKLITNGLLNPGLTELKGQSFKMLPARTLTFPAADLEQLSQTEDSWELRCHFLGLYGVDSPLPMYMNQYAMGSHIEAEQFRDFLDLLHQRSYQLYFMSWQQFRPEYSAHFESTALVLGGQGSSLIDPVFNAKEKLALFISEQVPGLSVRSCSASAAWRPLVKPCVLNAQKILRLGDDSYLGDAVYDAAGWIDIAVDLLDIDLVRTLLPGQPAHQKIRQYIAEQFESFYRFRLTIRFPPDAENLSLGDERLCLGWNIFLSGFSKSSGKLLDSSIRLT